MTGSTCEAVDEISSTESLHFHFPIIRVATDNFSDANKLGQGGFGVVYKVIWQFHMVKYQLFAITSSIHNFLLLVSRVAYWIF